MARCLVDHSDCGCYNRQGEDTPVRERFEYREMVVPVKGGMKISHAVYDTWYNKVRSTSSSKYACKQIIKRIQEVVELDV